ncbi:MAG: ECF-type sigma factor [Bacteroidota bacterium]
MVPPPASARPARSRPASADVTRLIDAFQPGAATGGDAQEVSFQQVYAELQALAREQRRRWQGNLTLNTTSLVHEAYLKLVGRHREYASRAHFLSVASKAMRHILITYATRQSTLKRGGGQTPLPLDEEVLLVPQHRTDELLTLDDALTRLSKVDPRAAQVVECRFFGGLDAEETATALGLSRRTVSRDWRAARAWLFAELGDTHPIEADDPTRSRARELATEMA